MCMKIPSTTELSRILFGQTMYLISTSSCVLVELYAEMQSMNVICQNTAQEKTESVQWTYIKRMEIHVERTQVTVSMVSALQSIFSVD
jgi:hypothetical protein